MVGKVGICALTGERGRLVRSHILPRALTRLTLTGEKAIESGLGIPSKRRPPTWYDDALVTRRGEDILEKIDAKAIAELRRRHLVWSGWGDSQTIPTDDADWVDGKPFCRWVDIPQPEMLRVFFISLAWRAAASNRPECEWVQLAPEEIDDLRRRVVTGDPGDPADYPVQLFQCVDRGPDHNRTPLLEEQSVPLADGSAQELRYIRIYLEGLTAYLYLARKQPIKPELLGTMLGYSNPTFVIAQRFSESRAAANLVEVMQDYSRREGLRLQLRP